MPSLIAALADTPLIGILRGCPLERLVPVVEAAADGGLSAIEVTLDSPDPLNGIRAVRAAHPNLCVGAGTVRDVEHLKQAIDAGAQFIVAPTLRPDVVEEAVSQGVDIVPGAATPSEIQAAWDLGATMVKVFPAAQLGGPDYIRSIAGVLGHPPLVPTGGVRVEEIGDYLAAGATAAGLGSSIFSRDRLRDGSGAELAGLVADAVDRAGS